MNIDIRKLDATITEAKKFIERAEVLRECLNTQKTEGDTRMWYSGFPKESGAMRRQSMELTRSLADLRRY